MKKFNCPCGAPMKEYLRESGRQLIVKYRCTGKSCNELGELRGKNLADIGHQINRIRKVQKDAGHGEAK